MILFNPLRQSLHIPMADSLRLALVPTIAEELAGDVAARLGLLVMHESRFDRLVEQIVDAARQHGDLFYDEQTNRIGLRSWWSAAPVGAGDILRIAPSVEVSCDAAYDTLMRNPYMTIRGNTPPMLVNRARANGKMVEEFVVNFFRTNWPGLFLHADNFGKYNESCPHDFTLSGPNLREIHCDVASPRLYSQLYEAPDHKERTDYHVLARADGDDVIIESIVRGNDFRGVVDPETGLSPVRFAVFLNCVAQNLPYNEWRALCR